MTTTMLDDVRRWAAIGGRTLTPEEEDGLRWAQEHEARREAWACFFMGLTDEEAAALLNLLHDYDGLRAVLELAKRHKAGQEVKP